MPDASTATRTRIQLKTPSQWKVILHNDDFTPFEFVTQLLQALFNKTADESEEIARVVHNQGKAQIGLYTKEIAVTKVTRAQQLAEEYGHPLLVTTEEA